MALQRVPWIVSGGSEEGQEVEHPAPVARQATFAAMGGETGVIGPDSLVVHAGATPGPFVTIGPGLGTVTYAQGRRNAQDRSYAEAKDQQVTFRNDGLEEIEVQPTTSAGGRVDAVVIEVRDPEYWPGTGTVDYSSHRFLHPRVFRNVSRSRLHAWEFPNLVHPLLLLAVIDIPPNTATITDDMISDRRHPAIIKHKTTPLIGEVSGSGHSTVVPYTQTSWRTVMTFSDVVVPNWASRAIVDMDFGPLYNSDGRANGQFRVLVTGQNSTRATVATSFVQDSGVYERFMLMTAGSVPLHFSTAGATCRLELQVRRTGGSDRPGNVHINNSGVVAKGSVTFEEAPMFDAESGL